MFTFCYIAFLICLLLVALFAASEAALAATNRVRLRQLMRSQAQSGDDEKSGVDKNLAASLSDDEQRYLATVTIAANVPLVIAAALCVWLARDSVLDSPFQVAIVCAITALIVVPIFQIVPRLLAARPGALTKLWWVRPARVLVALLRPFVSFFLGVGTLILQPLGLLPVAVNGANDNGSGLENASEIRDLVESAQSSGALHDNHELIESIFSFGDTRVHEVMIPRPDIIALAVDSALDAALDTLQNSGLSRLPIYEDNIDRVLGVLYAKDLLLRLDAGEDLKTISLRDLMREPVFLPEARKIDEALETMRARRSHLALIIDEYGGTAGLLTIEDILEELVGEIADEHDAHNDPLVILDENSALVDALLHIDDLADDWNLVLPGGEFETVGGFVIETLGRAPSVGDRVETESATLTVQAVRGRRPHKILVQRKAAPVIQSES